MRSLLRPLLRLACLAILAGSATGAAADDTLRRDANALFGRIEAPPATLSAEAELGRALFWDPAISSNGHVSCASCHPASAWGADAEALSLDALGKRTPRNAPTVFNAGAQPSLRWLGDRPNLASQAEGSLTGSMGFASKQAALETMRELGYESAFRAAYPRQAEPLSTANYGRAIAAYEATLTTPGPFDRFLAGDDTAMSVQQRAGLAAFIETGCAICHNGPLLGGASFQKFGIARDYWTATGSARIDTGRASLTGKDADRYVFRVPMLRNVARTGPWFHDGAVRDLPRVVKIMADVQLGVRLDDRTAGLIVTFLEALTGPVPAAYAPPPPPGAGIMAFLGSMAGSIQAIDGAPEDR
jgi:cytochrome c peroxidase